MGCGEGCGEGFQGFPYVDWLGGWPVQTSTTRSPDLIKVGKENVPFKVYDTSLFILEAKDPWEAGKGKLHWKEPQNTEENGADCEGPANDEQPSCQLVGK